jgi:hypothetical protein
MAATYTDLEDLQVAFKTHACHLHLEFSGEAYFKVMVTNRGDSPLAILRPTEDVPGAAPWPPGCPHIWRVHAPRTGVVVCEGTAAGVAQHLAGPEAGLLSQQ